MWTFIQDVRNLLSKARTRDYFAEIMKDIEHYFKIQEQLFNCNACQHSKN